MTYPYQNVRQAPSEGQATNPALATGGGDVALVSNVSSGHATRIEVLVSSDVNVTPGLIIYGANGNVAAVVALAAVVGGTDSQQVHTEACGQYYTVTINNASGGPADVTVWTGAKG